MKRLLLYILSFLYCNSAEFITVVTSRGSLQGFDHDFGNDTTRRFFGYGQMFLGIPFAKPPLGEKRFTLPEDICQYNGRGEVHNATYYRPACLQTGKRFDESDENCLYLNVMTPNVSGKYPVMVYIHGGAFATGSAEKYHWKGAVRNLVSRGVVVVTIQYRLGMIGFFTTFTDNFPPNRGLYDQILALRWVNEEIASFGGDASRITIFGQSAGAVSVSDLSLSPLSQGLFHQLIQESGSAMVLLETMDDPRGSMHQMRVQQICQLDSTNWGSAEKDDEIMNCLLKASPQDLVEFDLIGYMNYNAAIDGAFLPDYPENLAKTRPKYPTLIGDVLEEAAWFIDAVQDDDLSNVTELGNQEYLQALWPNYDDATAKNLSDIMIAGYSDGIIPIDNDHLGWTKLITNTNTGLEFSAFMVRDAQWHRTAGNENLWLFTFTHRSLLGGQPDIDGWIPVSHNSELPYLWFYPDTWETGNTTDADFAVADYMGKFWTDFAKNGELILLRAAEKMNFMDIGDLITVNSNWRKDADDVYNKQFPEYLGEFPPLKMSEESYAKVNELGAKVIAKWNSMKCPAGSTAATDTTTTSSAPVLPCLSIVVFISQFTIMKTIT